MSKAREFLKGPLKALLVLTLLGLGIVGVSAIVSQGFSFTNFVDNFRVQEQPDGLVGAYDVAIAADGTVYFISQPKGALLGRFCTFSATLDGMRAAPLRNHDPHA